jgi:hypothetical protein
VVAIRAQIQKQISIFVPISTWRALRHEAAVKKIPITEIARQLMQRGGLHEVIDRYPAAGSLKLKDE